VSSASQKRTPDTALLCALRGHGDDEIARALVALGPERIGGVVLGLKEHLTAELQAYVLRTWMTGQAATAAAPGIGASIGEGIGRGLAGMFRQGGDGGAQGS